MAGIAACIFNELLHFTAALYHRNQVTAPWVRARSDLEVLITEYVAIIIARACWLVILENWSAWKLACSQRKIS
jgi:hypothetical protein